MVVVGASSETRDSVSRDASGLSKTWAESLSGFGLH